jgi:glycosyltransferase involved in cell wall biosynthesis
MHICLFSLLGVSENVPSWGGVQTHARNLVRLLLKDGHEVSVVTGAGKSVEKEALSIIPIGDNNAGGRPDNAWFQGARKAFLKLNESRRVDCIFSEGGGARCLMNLFSAHQLPVITFAHSLSMHYFYNNWQEVDGWRALRSYLFRTVPRAIYEIFKMDIAYFKKCQKVVTGSSRIGRHLKRYYRLPADKIRVIHNWLNPNEFKKDESTRIRYREQFGLKQTDLIFLLVGSLWRPKGFRTALRAFKTLLETFPNAFLFIAGDGPDRSYMENYSSHSEHLSKRVKMLGSYPHEKLPLLSSSADVFIIPSLLNEVLPYTLLEAMSCELPVIASDIPANREALGPNGFFFPPGDVKALTNGMLTYSANLPQKKTKAGSNRKRIIERFSDEMASKRINSLLIEVFEGSTVDLQI